MIEGLLLLIISLLCFILARMHTPIKQEVYVKGINELIEEIRAYLHSVERIRFKMPDKPYTDTPGFKNTIEKIRNRLGLVEEHLWAIKNEKP